MAAIVSISEMEVAVDMPDKKKGMKEIGKKEKEAGDRASKDSADYGKD